MSKNSFSAVLVVAGVIANVGCKADPAPGACTCADAATEVLVSDAAKEADIHDAPIDVSVLDAVVADPSTGIAECDAYVKYFKACVVMIASWTPASAQAAVDVMINEYATAGATPAGKTMIGATCVSEMAAFRKMASATCPDVK